jgi:PAS domain S-box-containing protein
VKDQPLGNSFLLSITHWWPIVVFSVLTVQAGLLLILGPSTEMIAYHVIVNVIVGLSLFVAAGLATWNAIESDRTIRIFWSFLAVSLGIWMLYAWNWTYTIEILRRNQMIYLMVTGAFFLHTVFLIAAVASRPHVKLSHYKPYRTPLSFLLLLFSWAFAYAFVLFPLFYDHPHNVLVMGGLVLHVGQNLFLLAVLGTVIFATQSIWKSIYWHLLGASTLSALGTLISNLTIVDKKPFIGVPALAYSAAAYWFVWIALRGRTLAPELAQSAQEDTSNTHYASTLAMAAVVAIPMIGVWELLRTDELPSPRIIRLLIVLLAVLFLAMAASFTGYFTQRELSSDIVVAHERLRMAMASGKSVGWEWDLATGQDRWFGDLKTMFGIPSDTFSGRTEDFYHYVYPEDRKRLSETVADARVTHKPYESEFRVVRQDGAVRWIAARGSFYYSKTGEAERMLGMAVDITERKRVEEALKNSEEKFSKSFRESPLALVITNTKDLRVLEVNQTFEQLTGWTSSDVIGRSSLEAGLWVDPAQRQEFFNQLLSAGTVRNLEARYRRKNGTLGVGLISAELIEIEGKTCALSVMADITDRKQAEQALIEGEERFRLVANTAPVLIWMAGPDKLCTYVNRPWFEFTGRPLETAYGDGWTESIHPDDLSECLTAFSQATERKESFKMQYRLRRHDGEYRWMLDTGLPRFNSDQSFAGYIGSCVDITDHKQAEEALGSIGRRLIEAQEEERAWIARELHDDVNQRLALLAIELQRAKDSIPESEALVRDRIDQSRARLIDISKDVQALSHRLHSSKLEYLGLVAAANSFCKELTDRHKVTIEFNHSNIPQTLSQDISLGLFRVLQEALQNAVKHSGAQQFKVELHNTGEELHLTVSDSGIGFDSHDAMYGRGLGLISMRERLQLMKGKFSIESERGQGTMISAWVPIDAKSYPTSIAG